MTLGYRKLSRRCRNGTPVVEWYSNLREHSDIGAIAKGEEVANFTSVGRNWREGERHTIGTITGQWGQRFVQFLGQWQHSLKNPL